MEKALNGLTSVRQTRRSGGGAVGGDGGGYSIFDRNTPEGGETRGVEEEVVYQPQDDRSVMEHYLNLSIINVVNELLSWKSRYAPPATRHATLAHGTHLGRPEQVPAT